MSGKTRRGFVGLLAAGAGYTAINKLNQNQEDEPEWSDIDSLLGKNQANFNPQQNRSTEGLPRGQSFNSSLDTETKQIYTQGENLLAVFDDEFAVFNTATGEQKYKGQKTNGNLKEAGLQNGEPVFLTEETLYRGNTGELETLKTGLENPSMTLQQDDIVLADEKNLYQINQDQILKLGLDHVPDIKGVNPDTLCLDQQQTAYFSDQENSIWKTSLDNYNEDSNITTFLGRADGEINSLSYADEQLLIQGENNIILFNTDTTETEDSITVENQASKPITNGETLATVKDGTATTYTLEQEIKQQNTYKLDHKIENTQLAGNNLVLTDNQQQSHIIDLDTREKQLIDGTIEYISPQQQITNIDGETQITNYKQNM